MTTIPTTAPAATPEEAHAASPVVSRRSGRRCPGPGNRSGRADRRREGAVLMVSDRFSDHRPSHVLLPIAAPSQGIPRPPARFRVPAPPAPCAPAPQPAASTPAATTYRGAGNGVSRCAPKDGPKPS